MQNVISLINIDLLSLWLSIAATATLGLMVFLYDRKSITNRTFFAFAIIAIFWNILNYLFYQIANPYTAFWVIRFVIFFAVWYCFFLFRLFYVFPEGKVEFPAWYGKLLTPGAVGVSALTLTPLVFQKIGEISATGKIVTIINGPGIPIFGMSVGALVVASLVVMLQKFRKASGKEQKYQAVYILVGTAITFSLYIVFNFILPAIFNDSRFVHLSAVFTFPLVALTAYAIFKHKLFNVKVIATEALTFAIWLILFLRIFEEQNVQNQILDGAILLFVIIFGVLLIKSVRDEVAQKEQLELLSQAKTEFISIASHQLRTPLTAVKGYISLLLEGTYGKLAIKPEGVLKKVYVSNERLSNIVEDLLNVSRMDQGRLIYNFAPTDLIRVLTEIVDELKITAEIKHVDLSFEKPDDPAAFHMQADTEKLHQAIGNLVDNALKYTPQGSVRVKIEKTSAVPQKIVVTVRDSGIGLNPEDKMKIFERFSRGREGMRVNTKGTGLGLFIAKSIVESHGGTLHAESAGRNMGSSFIVELPLNFQPPIGKK